MGKLENKDIRKLLTCIRKDKRVIIPPQVGYDSGVHVMGGKYVVVSTDPCIGVPEEWFGWLLIHYAASDVALYGAKPEFCTINLLGPLSIKPEAFHAAMIQACGAADKLNIAIVTGHTGTYNCFSKLVGVCTAYGTVEPNKLITPGKAKQGDLILFTKKLGLETLTNFSLTRKVLAQKLFGTEQAEKLARLVPMQSCVKEALQLAGIIGVHAMHDATEGGLVVALDEMAEASGLGFRIESEKIPISREAWILQKKFALSDERMLSISSTGSIIAAVDPQAKDKVKKTLKRNSLPASFMGVFTESEDRILARNSKDLNFPQSADDPYDMILSSGA
jgi:hydrogenase maturation factor